MLKQISLIAVLAAVAVVPSTGAKAYLLRPYVGLGLGSSSNTVRVATNSGTDRTSLNGDFAYTFAGGFQVSVIPLISPRVEFEYASFSSSKDGAEADLSGYGLNGYVSLPIMPIVRPYIGVGVMRMKQDVGDIRSDTATVPQYMLGLDLDIPMIPIAGGIEWRYMNLKADVDGDPEVNNLRSSVSTILAKVRVQL
jgi:opacity protein-like surface antigen